jgi:hypothetical protein
MSALDAVPSIEGEVRAAARIDALSVQGGDVPSAGEAVLEEAVAADAAPKPGPA